ncbi:MAG: DNA alkylation repair protein [Patescibacteria group bacterium]|nr:DNA alkylation repair protein [Patescibacteria group bacterium]
MVLNEIKKDLQKLKNPVKAKVLAGFSKTGKGEYGEGDIFLGIPVPKQREVAKKYFGTNLNILKKLLESKIHEQRLTALFILIDNYKKADETGKEKIVDFYLKNTKYINNWDLVDLSAPKILGDYLLQKDKSILYKLAKSNLLWERRIAIIATYEFIKNNQFKDILKISYLLLNDKQDLIHKAVGWMLREVGKRNQKIEEEFLKKYYKKMPRTMLRYAIERFPENKRQNYLKGRF